MNHKTINWVLFIAVSFIWGSSFILMKAGLRGLSPYEVASIRIVTSGLVLFPIVISSIRTIPSQKFVFIFLSGVLGSLLPAYLFCIAEGSVDSALAGTLNSLTPIFVLLTGYAFFGTKTSGQNILGVIIAFTGSVLLFLGQKNFSQDSNVLHVLLIIAASFCYGLNVHLVHRHLSGIPSIKIVSLALFLCAVPAFMVLFFSGFFKKGLLHPEMIRAIGFSSLLGLGGTSLASILFYVLIKRAGPIFPSMVTYAIPFFAIMWGVIFGEYFGIGQAFCLLLILGGVYISNKKSRIS